MMRDKRGFALIYGLMLGVVVFLLALGLAPSLRDTVNEQLTNPLLNCSTTTDAQIKAVCTSIDLQNIFVMLLIGIGGIIIIRHI